MSSFAQPPSGAPHGAGTPVERRIVGARRSRAEARRLFARTRLAYPAYARRAVGVLAAICVALLAPSTATPLSANQRPTGDQTVRVDAGRPLEFAFTLSTTHVHPGIVTFLVRNRGRIPHDFEIRGIRTRAIPPGGAARLTFGFREPGTYHYVSTLPGQELAGMLGYLTVGAAG
jgi:uncharacterized cupredoxin-like copper-binding protein